MIVQNFFDTDLFYPENSPYIAEFTADIEDVTPVMEYPDGWTGAYWLGWIRWENLPPIYKKFSVESIGSSTTDFKIIVNHTDTPRNSNIGYLWREGAEYSYYVTTGIEQFIDGDGHFIENTNPQNYSHRFINKLVPMGIQALNTYNSIDSRSENYLNIVYWIFSGSGTLANSNVSGELQIYFDDIKNGILRVLTGDTTKNVSVNAFGNTFTLRINTNDSAYEETYPGIWTETQEISGTTYTINWFIFGWCLPSGFSKYDDEITQYNQKIVPVVESVIDDIPHYIAGSCAYVAPKIRFHIESGNIISNTFIGIDNGFIGDLNGELPYDWYNSADYNALYIDGNCAFRADINIGHDHYITLYPIWKPEDIVHALSVNIRMECGTDYTTATWGFNDDVYVPHVTENNEFLCEFINGEFSEIENDLRHWQYENITVNDYTKDDLPPYEPPAPIDDMYGDDITPPNFAGIGGTNGFITHYALTPSQMGRLGAALWAGVADNQFWDSIAVVLDNTLSINPADILNYIVAVRQYPMALQDTNACDILTLKDIYIGRGGYGLTVASDSDLLYHTIARMNRPVSLEYGGYLDIAPFYNDFRDYEPCTEITLHVPFCGSCKLAPSQVVGKQLLMQYSIDYTSGSITAICNVRGTKTYPVAVMHGQIGANIQMSASETMDNLQNVAAIGAGVATFALNPAAGTAVMAGNAVATSLSHNHAQGYSTGRSGGFSTFFEVRKPYVIITHDVYETPQNFAHVYGNATNCEKLLGNLHGYTECENVDVSGLTCTADDAAIIKRLLESGVYMD